MSRSRSVPPPPPIIAIAEAEQIAYQWLATDSLPPFAVQSLRELLLDIWQQQPTPIAS